MRNIYEEELTILWENYEFTMDALGFYKMIESSLDSLRTSFILSYKSLIMQVKEANKHKEANQAKYNLLKLRRLIAYWVRKGYVTIEGGVYYELADKNMQFPKFRVHNPKIVPTDRTLQKLQIKVLKQFVSDCDIQDLRSFRSRLIKTFVVDEEKATELTRLFRSSQSSKDLNDFSESVL